MSTQGVDTGPKCTPSRQTATEGFVLTKKSQTSESWCDSDGGALESMGAADSKVSEADAARQETLVNHLDSRMGHIHGILTAGSGIYTDARVTTCTE